MKLVIQSDPDGSRQKGVSTSTGLHLLIFFEYLRVSAAHFSNKHRANLKIYRFNLAIAILATVFWPAASQAQPEKEIEFHANTATTDYVLINDRDKQEYLLKTNAPIKIRVQKSDVIRVYEGNGLTDRSYLDNKRDDIIINSLAIDKMNVLRQSNAIRDLDGRTSANYAGPGIDAAYSGYHIAKFESARVDKAKTKNIFKGLSQGTFRYQTNGHGIFPIGCNFETIGASRGSENFKEHYTRESATQSWGFDLGAGFPVAKNTSVSAGLGFGGSTEKESTSRNFYTSQQYYYDSFYGSCDPYRDWQENTIHDSVPPKLKTPPYNYFELDFLQAIDRVNDNSSAKDFVSEWGTHYAKQVIYGGYAASMTVVSEEKFYEAKEFNVNLSAEIKKQADISKAFNPNKAGGLTQSNITKGSNVSGNFGLTFTKRNESEENIELGETYFHYRGHTGAVGERLSVTNDSAQPIRIKWGRLDDLLKSEILNSTISEGDLERKQGFIKDAIDDVIKDLGKNSSAVIRGVAVRMRVYQSYAVDDTDHNISGKVRFAMSGSNKIVTWDVCNHPSHHKGGDGKCWVDRDEVDDIRDWSFNQQWHEYIDEGRVEIQPDGTPKTIFSPDMRFQFEGEIIDGDVGPGNTRSGPFSISFPLEHLEASDGIVEKVFTVKGGRLADRTEWNIHFEFRPMLLPGNAPEQLSASTRSTRSAPHYSDSSAVKIVPTADLPDPLTHYLSSVLDPEFYLAKYPELRASIGSSADAAANHWLRFGITEGRQSSEFFSIKYYVENNRDVKQLVGNDYVAALQHWLDYGRYSDYKASPVAVATSMIVDSDSSTSSATPIIYGAEYNIRNMYQVASSYLDVRNAGTKQGSLYGVSTATSPQRHPSGSTGIWRFVSLNGTQNGMPVRYGDELHVQNKYNNWASYLDINGGGCEGNIYCVSAAPTPDRDPRNPGTAVWRIRSTGGQKPDGSEVLAGDDIHLKIQFNSNTTYLDIRNGGCDGNLYCVSTASSPTRDSSGTGTWRIQ